MDRNKLQFTCRIRYDIAHVITFENGLKEGLLHILLTNGDGKSIAAFIDAEQIKALKGFLEMDLGRIAE
jgi:hypothetical protein